MTNKQKAAMLECIALGCLEGVADLLRECAAMMREREAVRWVKVAGSSTCQMALYRGWLLEVREELDWWRWAADSAEDFCEENCADSLESARLAAVAWVDEQEPKG